jgi:hypothetical protein
MTEMQANTRSGANSCAKRSLPLEPAALSVLSPVPLGGSFPSGWSTACLMRRSSFVLGTPILRPDTLMTCQTNTGRRGQGPVAAIRPRLVVALADYVSLHINLAQKITSGEGRAAIAAWYIVKPRSEEALGIELPLANTSRAILLRRRDFTSDSRTFLRALSLQTEYAQSSGKS